MMRRLLRDPGGNATIVTALSLLVLIGAAGVGTDTVQWTLLKRKLQREADSAARAGALAKMSGSSVTSAALAEIERYTSVTLLGSPVIENAPTSGTYAGDTQAVRVTLEADASLPFSGIFLNRPVTMRASATAAAIGQGDYCILALETGAATGITATGNTTAALGCGMAANAQGSSAIAIGGSSYVTATSLMAVGAISAADRNLAAGTAQIPYALVQPDPFAGLPDPVVPGGCSASLTVNPNQSRAVANDSGTACYKSMDLKGTVTFAPGVYLIDGGSISINATANVSGSEVIFILTSSTIDTAPGSAATITINGNARINLTAPTSGTYAGVFLYQDRRASLANQANDISGNSGSVLQGAIYFPAQKVKFTGNSGLITIRPDHQLPAGRGPAGRVHRQQHRYQ
ncbi:hypothetical protein H7F51_12580 [Novosphingobium flavum]|uniref:Putative Flp pilus-assembly TadG-like N-terminal domain-containing protein n=1 Tax=Novosphingobium flavum TaxID=1778672 RepID=A0A7X1KM81_9SPHN|nr:pilus assembly protein TadG-related protein [Novosphingobium flavum]MBC2666357.1 hypothetical protein [Novosphingobium flavum]